MLSITDATSKIEVMCDSFRIEDGVISCKILRAIGEQFDIDEVELLVAVIPITRDTKISAFVE